MSAARLVDLLRHGEPEGGRRYRGNRVDDPLSERGWRQMWAAVPGEPPWRSVVTSPMERCRAFAEALGRRQGLPITVDPDLREVGFGAWEGRRHTEIEAASPGLLARFRADPVACRPPAAEPLEDFAARVASAWERILDAAGDQTLVVCHAGVIRAVLARVLGMPLVHMYRIQVAYAGLTRLRIEAGGLPVLVFHRDAPAGPA